MEQPNLSISVPPIWVDFCPMSFSKVMKSIVGTLRHMGKYLLDNIPGQNLDLTPGKGETNPVHSTDLPDA